MIVLYIIGGILAGIALGLFLGYLLLKYAFESGAWWPF